MNKVKIIIIEDQPHIQNYINKLLNKLGYQTVINIDKGVDILREIKINKPDLIILDLGFSADLNGYEIAELLDSKYNIPIIFLNEVAEYNPNKLADFIRNEVCIDTSIKEEELYHCIDKVFKNISYQIEGVSGNVLKINHVSNSVSKGCFLGNSILIKKEKKAFEKVGLSEIIWIENIGTHCKVKVDDHTIYLDINFEDFIEFLDSYIFLQVHQDFIINAKRLSAFKSEIIMMDDCKFIKIGKEYKSVFRGVLQFW